MVVAKHSGVTWVHAANLLPEPTAAGVYSRSLMTFEKVSQMLAKRKVRYQDVIRTWIYLGDIVGPEGDTQRLQRAQPRRTDFYTHFNFCQGHTPADFNHPLFPASTGIGTDGKGVMISCLALQTDRTDLVLLPLENPQQTSAFDYGSHYSPQSPEVRPGDGRGGGRLGHDLRFRHGGDHQFREPLSGRRGGTDPVDLGQHCRLDLGRELLPARQAQPRGHVGRPVQVRVYIKRQEDYARCRAVCEARLGARPIIYAVADVCRPELLMEIEGVAFSHTECELRH